MLLFWKSSFINYNKRKIQKQTHSQPVNRDGPNNLTWADPFVGKH